MMNEMMEQCCRADGKPDFDMIKQFMEHCGKSQFSNNDMQMMKQFCGQEGMPDMTKMKQMMESCGCHMPETGQEE